LITITSPRLRLPHGTAAHAKSHPARSMAASSARVRSARRSASFSSPIESRIKPSLQKTVGHQSDQRPVSRDIVFSGSIPVPGRLRRAWPHRTKNRRTAVFRKRRVARSPACRSSRGTDRLTLCSALRPFPNDRRLASRTPHDASPHEARLSVTGLSDKRTGASRDRTLCVPCYAIAADPGRSP
jgi:hypothetical protein